MVLLLQLYWSFVKIAFTSFGGLSMIPLITSEMTSHGWMTEEQVSDLVAIAEMTPGPMGLNCSTFAGIRAAGIPGALAAGLGILTPTLTLTLLAGVFFERFRESRRLNQALVGIRPASMGLLVGVMISLALTNYFSAGTVSLPLLLVGVADTLLLVKLKWSVPAVIGVSALAGVLFA